MLDNLAIFHLEEFGRILYIWGNLAFRPYSYCSSNLRLKQIFDRKPFIDAFLLRCLIHWLFHGQFSSRQALVLQESFTVMLGSQMKLRHNPGVFAAGWVLVFLAGRRTCRPACSCTVAVSAASCSSAPSPPAALRRSLAASAAAQAQTSTSRACSSRWASRGPPQKLQGPEYCWHLAGHRHFDQIREAWFWSKRA